MAAPMKPQILCGPENFPVLTKQVNILICAVEINTTRTELIVQTFQDRIFIIVTQFSKIGTLVSVTNDRLTDTSGAALSMASTNVLMGADEPITHVIARNLVTEVPLTKPILLSVALKDSSPKTVKTLAKILPSLL
ncbi:proteasome assembly chaperone 3-like isoform X2 [Dreissena polymorpha]|uniref:proteasome assembly chaperone 3-like isoform X2 n=1 Tax=Dreissena polymorpha TaxID=45954 RepID=UPI0022648C65|nr:proteasome assembly chaperone 3-like isoform X2 [Dreissena polymorpha]